MATIWYTLCSQVQGDPSPPAPPRWTVLVGPAKDLRHLVFIYSLKTDKFATLLMEHANLSPGFETVVTPTKHCPRRVALCVKSFLSQQPQPV